eukprot:1544087-Pleurochrysis_carterae.AAC.1
MSERASERLRRAEKTARGGGRQIQFGARDLARRRCAARQGDKERARQKARHDPRRCAPPVRKPLRGAATGLARSARYELKVGIEPRDRQRRRLKHAQHEERLRRQRKGRGQSLKQRKGPPSVRVCRVLRVRVRRVLRVR